MTEAELKLSVFILAARNLAESVDDSGDLYDSLVMSIYDGVTAYHLRKRMRVTP